jgi:hypothetical protein
MPVLRAVLTWLPCLRTLKPSLKSTSHLLQTTIVPPKPEEFDFNLNLKNLDPLTAIFLPDLKIPDQGILRAILIPIRKQLRYRAISKQLNTVNSFS